MLRSLSALALCLSFLPAAVADAQSSTRQIPVTDKFFEGAVRWSHNSTTTYVYRWTVIEVGGVFEVCGAGAFVGGQLRSQSRDVMKNTGCFVNDQLYLGDMRIFTRVKRQTQLIGASATCKSTGKRPPRKDESGGMRPIKKNRVF